MDGEDRFEDATNFTFALAIKKIQKQCIIFLGIKNVGRAFSSTHNYLG